MTEKPIVKIDNWSVGPDDHDPYKAPEIRPRVLFGVGEHPKLRDGERGNIRTSPITAFDWPNKRIETRNTIYQLGDIAPGYQKFLLLHRDTVSIATWNAMIDAGFLADARKRRQL